MLGNIFCLFPFGKKRDLHILSDPIEAVGIYSFKQVDLINNISKDIEAKSSVKEWLDKSESDKFIFITHFFYELGHLKYEDQNNYLNKDTMLGIGLKFPKSAFKKFHTDIQKEKIYLNKQNFVGFEEYEKAFEAGKKELMEGNCYQFNLTYPFRATSDNLTKESIVTNFSQAQKSKRGKFSMLTYIHPLNKAIWSNSPESLFQLIRGKTKTIIQTLPIKGTLSLEEAGSKQAAWAKLSSSEKDQAELYMITDLLRNDLNMIGEPTCRVIRKKVPLIAPGIMHQMSLIEIELSPDVSLSKIIDSLFPGGSITGAPKRRVMEIINRLENRARGAYCGSTILSIGNRIDCSINIRTAEIDLSRKELTYGAGGGITVLSEPRGEYEEMLLKLESFYSLF